MPHDDLTKVVSGTTIVIKGDIIPLALRLSTLLKSELESANVTLEDKKAVFTCKTKFVVFMMQPTDDPSRYECSRILSAKNYPLIGSRGNHIYNDLGDALMRLISDETLKATESRKAGLTKLLNSFKNHRDGINGIYGFDRGPIAQNRENFERITAAMNDEQVSANQKATNVYRLLAEKNNYFDVTARGIAYNHTDADLQPEFKKWEDLMQDLVDKIRTELSIIGTGY